MTKKRGLEDSTVSAHISLCHSPSDLRASQLHVNRGSFSGLTFMEESVFSTIFLTQHIFFFFFLSVNKFLRIRLESKRSTVCNCGCIYKLALAVKAQSKWHWLQYSDTKWIKTILKQTALSEVLTLSKQYSNSDLSHIIDLCWGHVINFITLWSPVGGLCELVCINRSLLALPSLANRLKSREKLQQRM